MTGVNVLKSMVASMKTKSKSINTSGIETSVYSIEYTLKRRLGCTRFVVRHEFGI